MGMSGTSLPGRKRRSMDEFFEGAETSWPQFEAVRAAVGSIGPTEVRVTKSQIAFRRRKTAPLVLTLALGRREASPRWNQVVEPAPGRFTHHLEVYAIQDIDRDVQRWLREAWVEAA